MADSVAEGVTETIVVVAVSVCPQATIMSIIKASICQLISLCLDMLFIFLVC